MTGHTPGPWQVETTPRRGLPDMHWREIVALKDDTPGWIVVAEVYGADEAHPDFRDAEANARLIAASPDLLEACQKFVCAVDRGMKPTEFAALDLLFRAAIAKATGETP